MTRKWTKTSRGMLFTWGMLVGLIFLFTPKSLTSRLQLVYAQVFRWPLETGRGLTLAARTTLPPGQSASRGDYEQLLAEKRRAENDRANLEAKLQEAVRKINQLAKLRVHPDWENMALLPAGVIQAQDGLIINRGRKNGVTVGQFVVSFDRSIIGTIGEVSPEVAKVRLITDLTSTIPVYIGDPNVRGIMEGRGHGVARIPLISDKHKIRVGERVYAQKKAGLLDVPIVTAEVTQCGPDPDNPLVQNVTVRAVCNIADLSEIAVVLAAGHAP